MSKSPFNILYVDDERHNLFSFHATFRKEYQVFTAQTGQEALELMEQEPIALVITDQRMPGMTGVQLLEKVLEKHPDTVRMVLTGYSDVDSIIAAINKGKVHSYITKPWKLNELEVTIRNALRAYQLEHENRALIKERNRLLVQAERQQKENLLSQFESLKNQINPHFLFNCLNALSLLVLKDPPTAEKFIYKLTDVYRYVLQQKGQTAVPLRQELQFMESYLFLQRIRFGNNLQLEMHVPAEAYACYLPPLALQLLVENAIKHNVVSGEHPLRVTMQVEGNELVIANNLQPREPEGESTGIGLSNLRARYEFITPRLPHFGPEHERFVARLPLLPREDLGT
ncbi:Response regulator receiver domain-containing protein [Catalinimonas alkaloidigena]|uniref:Response regulator receiver domain-containing protein n=1 Tax=Catalinimonas alkaloidigena TaxID=1075417 RepID=A0A1G8XMK8_9BACT|nr:histidine kinase [Catalinimonas alkaloidigena]SDJ91010.1 Response regulator receiver domain-containing protein [Catalinimonas alkaloidigena]